MTVPRGVATPADSSSRLPSCSNIIITLPASSKAPNAASAMRSHIWTALFSAELRRRRVGSVLCGSAHYTPAPVCRQTMQSYTIQTFGYGFIHYDTAAAALLL